MFFILKKKKSQNNMVRTMPKDTINPFLYPFLSSSSSSSSFIIIFYQAISRADMIQFKLLHTHSVLSNGRVATLNTSGYIFGMNF